MLDFSTPIYHKEDKAAWLRPVTTHRYLHPPRSDRMFTLWTEGKIILGRVQRGEGFGNYKDLISHGLWLVERGDRKLDFRKARCTQAPGGVPIHGLENTFGGFALTLEAFCDMARNPRCYGRITIENKAPYRATGQVGLALRTGPEKTLVYGAPDDYISYDPELSGFLAQKATWKQDGPLIRDGEATLLAAGELPLEFDEASGILRTQAFWLEPGEKRSFTFSFGLGEGAPFDYDKKRRECLAFWEKELSRVRPEYRKAPLDTFLAQLLQNFCYYEGSEDLVLRQGGLQRLLWPWEAMPALEALGRVGDFSREIEGVLSFYFDKMQQPDGEVKTAGEGWATVTAASLYSLATYCVQKGDAAYYRAYRDKALRTFAWLKAKRRESATVPGAVPGLFPPMRGSDWPQQFQHWTNTDVSTLFAMRALEKAAAAFGDEKAGEIRAEADDYFDRLRTLFGDWSRAHKDEDELRVPLTPDGNDAALLDAFYPYLLQGAFLRTGAVGEADIDRILRYHERIGLKVGGLHSRMPYRDGSTQVFYVCNGDFHWFYVYLSLGRKEEARQVLRDTLAYACTPEGYMLERYRADDPSYVPWSPNVSALGRTIQMILDCP